MSRKFRKTVASTLALAMMAGSISSMPEVQFSSIVQAAVTGATVTVNSETKTLKPGDTFTVTCDVTDNAEGFNALLAWITYNQNAFEMVKWENGARDDDDNVYNCVANPFKSGEESKYENPDSNLKTIVQMYFDLNAENYVGNCTLSKVTFKVREDAKAGEYEFSVSGDPELGPNGQKKDAQNRIVDGAPVVCDPVYKELKVKVDDGSSSVVTTTAAVPETTAASQTTTAPVTQAPVTTTEVTAPIPADAVKIELGEATIKTNEDGSMVATVPILAKNVGIGISTVQFEYKMNESFVVDKVNKGDFECSWRKGSEYKTLQFLTGDGCNIDGEGTIGKIKINIPAGTEDGVYPIEISAFEGSRYDKDADRQIPLEDKDFYGIGGKIVIGNAPADVTTVSETTVPAATTKVTDITVADPGEKPGSSEQEESESNVPGGIKALKLDAGKYKVEAGDTFNLKINISDNKDGFNALVAWLDFNKDVFELVSKGATAGDTDDPENEDSDIYNCGFNFNTTSKKENTDTFIVLMDSEDNIKGDVTLCTVKVKVKEGVKDGYYQIPFDAVGDGEDRAKANRIVMDGDERKPIVLNPSYLGAVVQVGNPVAEVTTPAVSETEPVETTVTEPVGTTVTEPVVTEPLNPPANENAVQIVFDKATYKENEDGSITATIPILAKNIGIGISTVQFEYEMNDTFVVDRVNKGDFECSWRKGSEYKTLQFLTGDGCNIDSEGIIGKVKITVPAGTPDGVYPIHISGFEGSKYDKDADKQIPMTDEDFVGVDGEIVIGNPPVTTVTTTEKAPEETTVPVTTKAPEETTVPVTTVTTEKAPVETTVTTEKAPEETTVTTEKAPEETTVTTEKAPEETTVTTEKAPEETTVPVTTKAPEETTVPVTTKAPEETTVPVTTVTTEKPVVTTPAVTEAPEPGPVKGDVDDNGVVNTRDFIKLKKFLLLAADKTEVVNGDVNGDKAINTIDLIHLVKILLAK